MMIYHGNKICMTRKELAFFIKETSWSKPPRTVEEYNQDLRGGIRLSKLEPGLFKKVTGLTVKDFELLVSLGVFNSALMNDAVYKFKRYEAPALPTLALISMREKTSGFMIRYFVA
ncbi:hypothetical protein IT6_03490 [Methylacidiphilum caldifontis]|nr:hypothetical protein [Methylacidiphilum caldifontis]QSR89355.1 hypothetical protein IT6_03490 [Methylacidiphilum caldifontis]